MAGCEWQEVVIILSKLITQTWLILTSKAEHLLHTFAMVFCEF